MLAYLKGIIKYINDDNIIIDVSGIGYKVFMPKSIINRLELYEETTIFTYLNVKEDSMTLYGFLSVEEVDVFNNLINVSGLGPKGAISILSLYTVKELIALIINKESSYIAKAPGIGKKTSEKIVIELCDKFAKKYGHVESEVSEDTITTSSKIEEVLKYVSVLGGISNKEVYQAIGKLEQRGEVDIEKDDVEIIVNKVMDVI